MVRNVLEGKIAGVGGAVAATVIWENTSDPRAYKGTIPLHPLHISPTLPTMNTLLMLLLNLPLLLVQSEQVLGPRHASQQVREPRHAPQQLLEPRHARYISNNVNFDRKFTDFNTNRGGGGGKLESLREKVFSDQSRRRSLRNSRKKVHKNRWVLNDCNLNNKDKLSTKQRSKES